MAYRRTDRYAGNWYVKEGRIVLKRVRPGKYIHETGGRARPKKNQFTTWFVERIDARSADELRPAVAACWMYYQENHQPEGFCPTKTMASMTLQVMLYGEESLNPNENI